MIQRIQSLLLLLGAAAVFGLFKLPFGTVSPALQSSNLFADGLYTVQDSMGLLGLFGGAGLLALIAIFLFNNRPLQITLSRISIIANILGIILAAILFMQDSNNMGAVTPKEDFGLGLPILSILFTIFAIRFINKDENLVQSMDRLR